MWVSKNDKDFDQRQMKTSIYVTPFHFPTRILLCPTGKLCWQDTLRLAMCLRLTSQSFSFQASNEGFIRHSHKQGAFLANWSLSQMHNLQSIVHQVHVPEKCSDMLICYLMLLVILTSCILFWICLLRLAMAGQVVSPSKGWNWRLYPRDAQPLRPVRGCADVAASLTWQLLRGLPMSPKREDWWLEMQMLPAPESQDVFKNGGGQKGSMVFSDYLKRKNITIMEYCRRLWRPYEESEQTDSVPEVWLPWSFWDLDVSPI